MRSGKGSRRVVFVDTGAWVALADADDEYHARAASLYPDLLRRHLLVTHNLVIAETYILIRRALGHSEAFLFLEKISSSPRIQKVYSDQTLEAEAESILGKYKDQDFSYTDAVSFALMAQMQIRQAFAFDHHFSTAGFERIS